MSSLDITYLDQSLAEELLWESYYGRVTMEELLCYYRKLSDISKEISVSTQPLRKVGGKEQLCLYFKGEK